MVKVLIAVDDTDESVEAAALARRLFGDGAEYLAINVFEHPLSLVRPGLSSTRRWRGEWCGRTNPGPGEPAPG